MKNTSPRLVRIALSALFLGIALVLKTVSTFDFPLFGGNGMRFGISGIFSVMPALLFGPWYGAAVSGLSDVLGYMLKPSGQYLFLMTFTAAAGGFIRGALWKIIKKRSNAKTRLAAAGFAAVILAVGLANLITLYADGVTPSFYEGVAIESINTDDLHLVSRLLVTRTMGAKDPGGNLTAYILLTTWGLIGSAVFGLLLMLTERLLSKRSGAPRGGIMPLFVTLLISGMVVTTLNTFILRGAFPTWKLLPFVVVWIPRVIEEIISSTINTYFVAALLKLSESRKEINSLILP